MAGHIEKRGDNVWRVTVFLGTDTNTGLDQRHRKTIHGTKKDAEKYMTGVLRDRDLGKFAEPSRLRFGDYLDQWMQQVAKARVRARTFQDYGDILKRVKPRLGTLPLDKVTPFALQKFYNEMLAAGLSPRTVRNVHVVLHSALKQAVRWRMIAFNPAQDVDLPHCAKKETPVLDVAQAHQFMEAALADPRGVVYLVALSTALRPGEYLALQWPDIDLTSGAISVQRTVFWPRGGGWVFEETKTKKSRRTVILPKGLLPILRRHRTQQLEHRLLVGELYVNHELVFATELGVPLNKDNLNARHFKRILLAAGLPNIRPYDLRHSCATLLLAANTSPKIVAEMLGHSSTVLTMDTYSHVTPTMQQQASDTLDGMLFPAAGL